MNLPQVASKSGFKIQRKHIYITLTAASMLPTILKPKQETTYDLNYIWFVNSHVILLTSNPVFS